MAFVDLINTLRGMEKQVCDTAAKSLEDSLASGSTVKLHLRSAGLDMSDAMKLAGALKNLSAVPDSTPISSFSVSYNHALGDVGTVALAKSLPLSVGEIGFVDCNFGDEGALALLNWAKQTSSLKMICIEQNDLSAHTRSLYKTYRRNNPSATVIF